MNAAKVTFPHTRVFLSLFLTTFNFMAKQFNFKMVQNFRICPFHWLRCIIIGGKKNPSDGNEKPTESEKVSDNLKRRQQGMRKWSIWEMGQLINFPAEKLICWRPCKHCPPLRSMALKGISCLFSCRLSLCGFISHPESREGRPRTMVQKEERR